jgi:hypothetical protein
LISQDDEVARPGQHLLLNLIDLRLQLIGAVQALHAGPGAHDGVEEDDGPKSATDAIEEGEREYFDGAAACCHG